LRNIVKWLLALHSDQNTALHNKETASNTLKKKAIAILSEAEDAMLPYYGIIITDAVMYYPCDLQ
jgi:hypothetical protein